MGWTVGGIMALVSEGHALDGVGFLLLGWAFGGGMVAFSIPLELWRARRLLGELHRRLDAAV